MLIELASLAVFTFVGFLLSFLIPETVGMTLEELGKGEMSTRNRWLHWSKLIELVKGNHSGGGQGAAIDPETDHDGEGAIPARNEPSNLHNGPTTSNSEAQPKDGGLTVDTIELDHISSSSRSANQERLDADANAAVQKQD
jgi:hypothetical protein